MDKSIKLAMRSAANPAPATSDDAPPAWAAPRRRPRRWSRHRLGFVGLVIVAVFVIGAIFAPWIAPGDPGQGSVLQRLMKPVLLPGGSPAHLLGTDQLGRDVLTRIVYGARVSLLVGISSTLLGGVAGTALGLIAGYYRGKTDTVIMRLTDIQLSFPFLALAIILVAVLESNLQNLILVLGFGTWVLFARVVRAEVLGVREREYVQAARSLGARDYRVLAVHILPNVLPAVIVIGTFTFAQMIIMEASLSFLGLGVQPPTPSWGGMLSDARGYMQIAWWLPVIPGLAILLVVLGINLVGDWLRDIWDPRLRTSDG